MSYSFQNKTATSAVTVGELNQVVNGVERPYKVYTALLTQTGTDAPVATVLENTLGNVWFQYSDIGIYTILIPEFDITKTYYSCGGMGDSTQVDAASKIIMFSNSDSGSLQINTYNNSPSISNNILNKTPIEIRVYN